MKQLLIALICTMFVIPVALATNTPCSGHKGGVAKCNGDQIICKDGSVSASKKVCTADLVKTYSNGSVTQSNKTTNSSVNKSKNTVDTTSPVANNSKDSATTTKTMETKTTKGRAVCTGKKGGAAKCDGDKFVCKDGSVSASTQVCTKALVKQYSGK